MQSYRMSTQIFVNFFYADFVRLHNIYIYIYVLNKYKIVTKLNLGTNRIDLLWNNQS